MTTRIRCGLRALAVGLLALVAATAVAPRVDAQESIDVRVLYDELDQYGRWFTHPQYGYVWSPEVEEDWRPYSRGHWLHTEEHGWYWQAEEPWGWGPFHYGRWLLDEEFGWIWIPGTEWGPAWVAWRYSDDQVGWAPLPPEAEWYEDRGLTFSATYYDAPRFAPIWCFVRPIYLTTPGLYRHLSPVSRNHFYLRSTVWGTNYRYVNRRIFNVGFDPHRYRQITRRPLVSVRVMSADSPRGHGFQGGNRGIVHAYRPRVIGTSAQIAPRRLVDPPHGRGSHRATLPVPGTPHGAPGGRDFNRYGPGSKFGPGGGGGPSTQPGQAAGPQQLGIVRPQGGPAFQRGPSAGPPQEDRFQRRPPQFPQAGPPSQQGPSAGPPHQDRFQRRPLQQPAAVPPPAQGQPQAPTQPRQFRPPSQGGGGPAPQFQPQAQPQQRQFRPPQAGSGGGPPPGAASGQPAARSAPAPVPRDGRRPPQQGTGAQQGGPPSN